MSKELKVTHWAQLPNWVRVRIEEIGVEDPERWIQEKIPALGGMSIADLAASEASEATLCQYFLRLKSGFP